MSLFWTQFSDHQHTTFTTQSTTFSPQKHHNRTPFFCKIPCKNTTPPQDQKNAHAKAKKGGPAAAEPPRYFNPTYTAA
jgi:hypothetical protein